LSIFLFLCTIGIGVFLSYNGNNVRPFLKLIHLKNKSKIQQ